MSARRRRIAVAISGSVRSNTPVTSSQRHDRGESSRSRSTSAAVCDASQTRSAWRCSANQSSKGSDGVRDEACRAAARATVTACETGGIAANPTVSPVAEIQPAAGSASTTCSVSPARRRGPCPIRSRSNGGVTNVVTRITSSSAPY